MENKKMCVWKRGGYFFIATLLGAGPFSSHVYAGTDHDQFNSVVTELNYGLNQKKEKKISGTVVDETGLPVIGANVVQKGTTNGVITDIDGHFSLTVPEDAILEISYIGYLAQSIPIGNNSSFQVTLREDSQKLDEVVVVGFGTQKKVNLTGAVSTVSSDVFEGRSVSNASQALQGAMPGLNIQQTQGYLDSSPSINIRGVGTIGEGSSGSPLISSVSIFTFC